VLLLPRECDIGVEWLNGSLREGEGEGGWESGRESGG